MNGAGKSTLFKALTGFVRPSRGRIRINGATVAQAQRQQAVAYVPQSEGIDCQFPVSVWDVVMMGRYGSMNPLRIPRSSDRVAVRDALQRVDLLDLRNRPIGTSREVSANAPFWHARSRRGQMSCCSMNPSTALMCVQSS